jgi:hypothetical protein
MFLVKEYLDKITKERYIFDEVEISLCILVPCLLCEYILLLCSYCNFVWKSRYYKIIWKTFKYI